MVKVANDIQKTLGSIAKGMGITIKYFFRKPVTQQFPNERWVLPERFRGFVHNDISRCTSCMLCAKACPVDCIYIEMEGKGKDRMMSRYAIDYNKCIWCSLCTESCPTNCITMSHDYDHAVYTRSRLVYEYVTEPVAPYKVPKTPKPAPAKPKAEQKPPAESATPGKPSAEDGPSKEAGPKDTAAGSEPPKPDDPPAPEEGNA